MVAQMKICKVVICTIEVKNVFLQNSLICIIIMAKVGNTDFRVKELASLRLYALQDKKKSPIWKMQFLITDQLL